IQIVYATPIQINSIKLIQDSHNNSQLNSKIKINTKSREQENLLKENQRNWIEQEEGGPAKELHGGGSMFARWSDEREGAEGFRASGAGEKGCWSARGGLAGGKQGDGGSGRGGVPAELLGGGENSS
ncbi:hypothetical protein RYX36_011302, partial [Vicia faba]